MSMLQAEAGAGGDDSIEEYKKEMAEFMAQAHEKRLQAMEAVKAEVQRGYEEQIAELQGKVCIICTWCIVSYSYHTYTRIILVLWTCELASTSAHGVGRLVRSFKYVRSVLSYVWW